MQLFSEFCNICYSKKYDTLTNICIADNENIKDILLYFIDNPYIINDADTYLCTTCCEQLLHFKEFREMCLNNLIEMREIYFKMKSKLELETDVNVTQELEIFVKKKVFGQSNSENGFLSNCKNVDDLIDVQDVLVRVKEENADQPPEVLKDYDPPIEEAYGEGVLGEQKCVSSVDESGAELHEVKDLSNSGDEFGDNCIEGGVLSNYKSEHSVFVGVDVIIKDEHDDVPPEAFRNNASVGEPFEGSILEQQKCILPIDDCKLKLHEVKDLDDSDDELEHSYVEEEGQEQVAADNPPVTTIDVYKNFIEHYLPKGNCSQVLEEWMNATEEGQLLQGYRRTHFDEKRFKCDVCDRAFAQRTTLLNHKRLHSGEKPYKCDVCARTFTQRSSLLTHSRVHTGEKPYMCDVCAHTFSHRCNLLTHQRVHTGEEPFKCEVCARSFRDQSTLLKHKRVHSGERPYQCDVCARSFTKSSVLLHHKRVHSGEKPHKCEVCARTFSQKSSLLRHKRTHSGEKPYKCEECAQTFGDYSNMLRHRRVHSGEKPYKCEVCAQTFSIQTNMVRHKLLHKRSFQCSICTRGFEMLAQLEEHERTHITDVMFKVKCELGTGQSNE